MSQIPKQFYLRTMEIVSRGARTCEACTNFATMPDPAPQFAV